MDIPVDIKVDLLEVVKAWIKKPLQQQMLLIIGDHKLRQMLSKKFVM